MSTKLDAINTLLSSIGESAVNSLTNTSGNLDLAKAIETFDRIDSMVQEEGWDQNTETMTLATDTEGYIALPANCLRVDSAGADFYRKIVARGQRLYDKENNSFFFDSSVTVKLVTKLDFEDLTAAAKRYITVRAAREFIAATVGDSGQYSYSREAVMEARNALEQAEAQGMNANLLESNAQLSRRERSI